MSDETLYTICLNLINDARKHMGETKDDALYIVAYNDGVFDFFDKIADEVFNDQIYKTFADVNCDSCKYFEAGEKDEPCKRCKRNYVDKWEPNRKGQA